MFVFRSSLFTWAPRVRTRGSLLEAHTSRWTRALLLFSYARSVVVSPSNRTVYLTTRRIWFHSKTRAVSFEQVDHVTYRYASVSTSWDILGRNHDRLGTFTVGIQLKDSLEVVPLARFSGEEAAGDVSTWLMGDDIIDFEGTQDTQSRDFATNLCARLQVPLGPPSVQPRRDAAGKRWTCESCGRTVSPNPKCLYCGGTASPTEA